jgi:hypothetical protein
LGCNQSPAGVIPNAMRVSSALILALPALAAAQQTSRGSRGLTYWWAIRSVLRIPRMPHMGFSDEPLILAAGDSNVLVGRSATPLDGGAPRDTAVVTVERFGRRP